MVSKTDKRRIEDMIAAIQQAASGDLSASLKITSQHDDLDELAQAVNALLESRRTRQVSQPLSKSILKSMQESYFEADLKGNIVFFNNTVLEELGYGADEFKGLNFQSLVDEPNGKKVYEAFYQIYRTGEGIRGFEWQLIRKNDGVIDVESSVSLLRDEAGKPRGFAGVVRNITRRKQAEAELRQSEERYRTILDIMEEAYLEYDLRGTITFANEAAGRIFQIPHEQLIGKNYREYHSPDVARQMYEVFHRIYETGKPELRVDHDMLLNDVEVRSYQVNAALKRDEAGKPFGFRLLAWDVTDRKRSQEALRASEAKYRSILENMQEAYLETDLGGHFIFFNDALCKMMGYARHELQNRSFRDFITAEAVEPLFKIFNDIYLTHKQKISIEQELIGKNGRAFIAQMSVSLMYSSTGESIGFCGIARDATEQIRAARRIQKSERRLRMITDNIRDVIWTMDFDGRVTYVSPAALTVMGYAPDALSNMTFADYLTPVSLEKVSRALACEIDLARNGAQHVSNAHRVMELEFVHRDQTLRWVEIITDFYCDENGTPVEIMGVTRDITERKKAEAALKESEKRYRMIVENMHDTIWTMDMNLNYTYQSPSEIRVTGYTPEEIMKVPIDRVLTPQSFARVAQILSEELELEFSGDPIDPNRSRTIEVEVHHKNGGTVWEEITASFNRDADGKPVEIMMVGRNITSRRKIEARLRESEKRYRMIVENMQDTITLLDFDLNYVYQSPSEIRISGYTPEEIMGIPVEKQMTPESFAMTQRILAEEVEREFSGEALDPNRSRTVEVEVFHKNGSRIWQELTASFNRDETGKPVGILMAGRDITARKAAEQERDRLAAQLLQAQKMETVGRLAGGVAHDFNNMLNVILGYADLAKLRLSPDHPIFADILEIEKAATRSRDLTTQLLAFSRKQIIAPKAMNLNVLIADTQKSVTRLIGEDIDLKFFPQEDLWVIKFDPMQAEQIIMNLAVNARDAMPQGGKLTIETSNVTLDDRFCRDHLGFTPGDYVLMAICDTGSGINTDHLPHVFEPFFTTKEIGKGTGLGLATVYGIVKQNDGFITVYSEPGQGSTFRIYIPKSDETIEKVEAVPPPPSLARSGEGTILLVEDDEMVLKMVADMLEALGYMVIASENPMDAVSLCEKGTPTINLVLTDVVMPVMSGREMRDRLRAFQPNLKVLFMSGYTSEVIVHHGVLEAGVQFIQKPFTMTDLARKLKEIMATE